MAQSGSSPVNSQNIQPMAYGFVAILVFAVIGLGIVNAAANK